MSEPSGKAGKTCPYCQSPIKPGALSCICDRCGVPHHLECWGENGRCTTYGCTGGQARLEEQMLQEPVITPETPPISLRRRHSIKAVAVFCLLAAAFFVAGVFASHAFWHSARPSTTVAVKNRPVGRISHEPESGEISINHKDGATMVWGAFRQLPDGRRHRSRL